MATTALLFAGFFATTVMIIGMETIHRRRWANADMVRAIGSIYTRSYQYSFLPGLVIHYAAGISFAFLYAFLANFAPVSTTGGLVIVCVFAGLVHGILFSLLLANLVAEHHPLAEFRRASFGVLLAHVVGHVFFGGSLGLYFGLTHAKETYLAGPSSPALEALGWIIGFGSMWIVLFGIPLLFFGYMTYTAWAARFKRLAHNADVLTGHNDPEDRLAS